MGSAMNFRASRWLVLLSVLALFAAACGGNGETDTDPTPTPDETADVDDTDDADDDDTDDADTDDVDTAEGGTVVWGYEQEPGILNPFISDGNLVATAQVTLAVLLPLWVITPDFEYVPSPLMDGEPEVDEGPPFSVTYNLNPDANWSDGEPITADDVLYSLEVCLDEEIDITSRAGCDVVDMEATAASIEGEDSKTITVVFTEPYAPWQTFFSTGSGAIIPRHVFEGEDFNSAMADDIPIASGPFMFESWDKGQQLTLVRNDNYVGEPAGLDQVVFRYIPDSNTIVQQLRGGEVDMINPQPQLDLVPQVQAIDGVEVQIDNGPVWEHIDFQATRPPLDQAYVRRALAMGVDRDAIIEQVILPMNPDAEPLNSIVYVNNQPEYEDHFGDVVGFDPEGAIALLEENGCERGDDDIFVCEGERLAFEFKTMAGNERREITSEILQAQWAEIGVELTIELLEAAVLFSNDHLVGGNFDIAEFAWAGSPDPASNVELWKCEGEQNYHGHCNEEASEILEESNRAVDPDERASLMNEAGRILGEEVPVLPLYQLPEFAAFNSNVVTGLQVNATQHGLVWNIGEWRSVSS
jgi:peptide/nickel transport system substrate-binding protein